MVLFKSVFEILNNKYSYELAKVSIQDIELPRI